MCEQYDRHNAFLSVKETLRFAARFYIPDAATVDDKVADILAAFGLSECADTRVGNAFIRGISGGQKKRLSLAMAMLKSPAIVFMDEPTSGLDAAGAAADLAGFCEATGNPVPTNANPADFFLELVNSEFSGAEVVDRIVAAWRKSPAADDS
eukprot:SAG22_NODE_10879_length_512_cov_0.769976_1_plen_151_part_01